MRTPAMYFADSRRLGRPFAKDPAVVRFDGRYLLYYSVVPYVPEHVPPDAPNGFAIGIAESTDLDTWRIVGEILPNQPCEQNGICAPAARVLDGEVHLFYQTYGNGPKDALCHAVSSDGLSFTRNPTNPVFAPTTGVGIWHNGRAIDADVIPWRDNLLLFFSTRDPSGQTQIGGVARARLGSSYNHETWTQISVDGPILRPELDWETRCIEAAAVCEHAGRLYMFYGGGYNNDPQHIGCAVCEGDDLTQWQRISDKPLLPNGPPGAWNSSESGHPFVFRDDDGRDHLFFQGNNDNGHTWFLSRRSITWADGSPKISDEVENELL